MVDAAVTPRSKNRDALNAEIEKGTVTKSTETWVTELSDQSRQECRPKF
jgi:formyl-CoA transferase